MPLTIEEQIKRSQQQTEDAERKKREREERKAALEEERALKKLQRNLELEAERDKPLTKAQEELYAKFPKANMIIDKAVVESGNPRRKPNVRFTSEDELIERAFDRYDAKYARGAARAMMPLVFRKLYKILRDKDAKPELVVKVASELFPYAFDRPGTAQTKDEGPKRVLIVKDAKELPDVE